VHFSRVSAMTWEESSGTPGACDIDFRKRLGKQAF